MQIKNPARRPIRLPTIHAINVEVRHKIRVYGSVDNVCTITGYSGIDPEVGNYGVDRGVYPVARTFNFGVNLNF